MYYLVKHAKTGVKEITIQVVEPYQLHLSVYQNYWLSMKANPDKFQVICIGKKTYDNIETFRIGETDIKCENNVSLLGINIDFMLKFDDHVTEICKKASKQLAVFKKTW